MIVAEPVRTLETERTAVREAVVSARGLRKSYGDRTALADVTFDVHPGEMFGLVGTNGAGKTTTVEILQGLRRASAGTARVLGLDPARHGDRLRSRIGAQLQDSSLPARMRVHEALSFFAALHPNARPLGELADEWALGSLLRRRFEDLSGGERQRLFVALALIGRPQVVFLDELTQNLDPAARRRTWEVIRRVRDSGSTVVLVTHDVEEAERLCDRIAILHRGRVIALGRPADVARGSDDPLVVFNDPTVELAPLLGLPGAGSAERCGDQVCVRGTGPILAHVAAYLVSVGRPPVDIHHEVPTLEQRFVTLTQEDSR